MIVKNIKFELPCVQNFQATTIEKKGLSLEPEFVYICILLLDLNYIKGSPFMQVHYQVCNVITIPIPTLVVLLLD